MKKYSSLTTSLLLIVLLTNSCVEKRKAKEYPCTQYSIPCELDKDNILIKPVTFDSTLVDAYGNPLDTGYWYLSNKQTKVLAPVPRQTRTVGGGMDGGYDVAVEYDDSTIFSGVQSAIVDLSSRLNKSITVKLILTGSGEMTASGSRLPVYAVLLKP